MKGILREFCSSIQIQSMGIAPIGPYLELGEILQARRIQGQYTEFEEQDIAKRIDPRLLMEDVQSIIVCVFPYRVGIKAEPNLAQYTYALDYHILIKNKMEQIGAFLTAKIEGFSYQAFADTGPLVDRYLAYLAGLGFYGMNNQMITEQYGSYIVIGYMLTNHVFEYDVPLDRACLQCGRCQQACPGQAILGDFGFDPLRCRSYLTQKKGELRDDEIRIIRKNDLVFGCDVCLDVCPHNQGRKGTVIQEFQEGIMPRIEYEELAGISNKEFMRRYGKRAFSWRGRKLLMRNFEYLL